MTGRRRRWRQGPRVLLVAATCAATAVLLLPGLNGCTRRQSASPVLSVIGVDPVGHSSTPEFRVQIYNGSGSVWGNVDRLTLVLERPGTGQATGRMRCKLTAESTDRTVDEPSSAGKDATGPTIDALVRSSSAMLTADYSGWWRIEMSAPIRLGVMPKGYRVVSVSLPPAMALQAGPRASLAGMGWLRPYLREADSLDTGALFKRQSALEYSVDLYSGHTAVGGGKGTMCAQGEVNRP